MGVKESLERMLRIYLRAHDLLWRHYRVGVEASTSIEGAYDKACFCGMGSSWFAGRIASIVLELLGVKAVMEARNHWRPPPWIDAGTLLVGVSYSGTTWETLECVRNASGSAGALAVVSSGGALAELARERDGTWVELEHGLPQRASLPAMVGGVLGIAGLKLGVDPVALDDWVSDAYSTLSKGDPGWTEELAGLIASSDFIVVAGCGYMGIAASRWRTELAENGKLAVKSEWYPESGHNDLVAYQVKPSEKTFFILLKGGEGACNELMEAVAEIYSGVGSVYIVDSEGSAPLAAIMRSAQLAGIVSAKAAAVRGVDPLSTPILERYRSLRTTS